MRPPSRRSTPNLQASALAVAAVMSVSAAHAQTVIINGTTETSPPFTVSPTDNLYVGTTGTGVLNVVSGTMETLSTTLGDTATGNGTVTVTGAGFGGPGSNLTIGNAGIGTFSASNVSSIYSAATYIGALAGSSGTATLSGSEWNVLGDFEIGSAGSGSLTVTGGAELTSLSEAIIGADVGSSGTVTLTGSGSTWTDNSTVYVGDNGTGTLTISDGAVFNGSNLEVGYSEGSTGTVTLTGSGSEVNLSSGLYVGHDSNGTFTVTDGATLNLGTNSMYIGYYEGQGLFNVSGGSTVISGSVDFGYYSDNGKGTANISGAGTTWTIDGDITLGDEGGAGELNITAGAQVSATGDLTMGQYDYQITRGDLTISGAGSQLAIAGSAYIGYERPAIVTVSNGGLLQIDGDTFISQDDTAPATVTITGAGSQFIAGDIYVGDYGEGTLNVGAGASVDSGAVYIGNHADGVGTLNVSGATTVWQGGPSFYVGYDGTGTMNITDGMKFDSSNPVGYFYLGYNGADAVGTVNISGAGTEVYVDNYVTVGGAGSGIFNVTGGAFVTADYLYGADGAGGGEMLVSGAGSTFNADYGAYIGYSGNFNAVVTDGGLLSASFTSLQIGYGSGTTAVVEVSNGGQVWSGQGIIVGGQGDGTLTLSTGASATANYMTIAAQAGSTGTLIFGAAASDPAVAAGTLSVPTVAFGSGTGEIVFNHTSDLTFAPAVGGIGAISVLSGTTTFATDSATFTGDVDVTGGKAVFNADYGGAAVEVSGGGIVGGNGTIVSLDVLSGGTVAPGNSPGTIHVIEGTTFAAGSTYTVEVAGAQSDLISTGSC